jgi:hypothetical protein
MSNSSTVSLEDLLNTPPSEWGNILKSPKSSQIAEVEREADLLCQKLALISEYLSCRGGAGCGDYGHQEALQLAHGRKDKVRKALGYLE